MRALVIALVAAPTILVVGSIATGCLKKPTFECASAAQCEGVGAGATCEPDGFCSFTDGSCESGRRYGDNSGPNAGQCVGAIPIDAAIDMPPDSPPIDARLCYGAGAYALCLASEPMGMEMLAGAIDTDTDPRCAAAQPTEWVTANQPATCFISAAQITVTGTVAVTGSRPLALLADSIVINAVIDVASHRGAAANGAGANSALCTTFTTAPTDDLVGGLAGGGAGGSFMTSGGNGARGDNNAAIPGGLATGAEGAAPTILRGGCPGQLGGTGAGAAGTPGPGGGAIFVSASTIAIGSGGGINASGAAAGAGAASGAGSGGGSGGMIVLHATSITNAGALIANGGGGASGGTAAAAGAAGNEPSVANPTTPASGGAGGGGPGGNGFAGTTQATSGGNANNRAGAGGGGGGGYIQSNIDIPGSVSPAETVVP